MQNRCENLQMPGLACAHGAGMSHLLVAVHVAGASAVSLHVLQLDLC